MQLSVEFVRQGLSAVFAPNTVGAVLSTRAIASLCVQVLECVDLESISVRVCACVRFLGKGTARSGRVFLIIVRNPMPCVFSA